MFNTEGFMKPIPILWLHKKVNDSKKKCNHGDRSTAIIAQLRMRGSRVGADQIKLVKSSNVPIDARKLFQVKMKPFFYGKQTAFLRI